MSSPSAPCAQPSSCASTSMLLTDRLAKIFADMEQPSRIGPVLAHARLFCINCLRGLARGTTAKCASAYWGRSAVMIDHLGTSHDDPVSSHLIAAHLAFFGSHPGFRLGLCLSNPDAKVRALKSSSRFVYIMTVSDALLSSQH